MSGYQTNIDKLQAQDNNSIQSSSAAPPEDSASNDHASSSHQRSLACATQSSDQPFAQDTEDDVTKATSSTSRDEFKLRWLLLCFDFYKYAGKTIHVNVQKLCNDVEMFRLFRQEYLRSREMLEQLFSWKKVKKISFVQLLFLHNIESVIISEVY